MTITEHGSSITAKPNALQVTHYKGKTVVLVQIHSTYFRGHKLAEWGATGVRKFENIMALLTPKHWGCDQCHAHQRVIFSYNTQQ